MPQYTPEPLPLNIDPVLSEYLHRELIRISNAFIGSDDESVGYQPKDADLTAISALATQSYGRMFLTYANEVAFKTAVNLNNLVIGVDIQGWTAVLQAITASYTTAEQTKLAGIAAGAQVNPTAAAIKVSYESNADTNAYTTAEKTLVADLADDYAGRLGGVPFLITDWNSATKNGFYAGGPATLNTPEAMWFQGVVSLINTGWITQTVWGATNYTTSADLRLWQRKFNSGTTWGPWYRLRWSEVEILAFITANGKLQKFYDSGQQTITAAGALTLAHGLGAKPTNIEQFLQCITIDGNFAVGADVLVTPNNVDFGSTGRNAQVNADATNLNIRFGNNGTTFVLMNPTTGAAFQATNTKWKYVVRAWL